MICIDRMELYEISMPLREPFRISSGVVQDRRILLLKLFDRDGISTWSECVAGEYPNYHPETVETARIAIRQWIAPRILGKTFAGPQEVLPWLDEDIRGHRMAKAAVEMGMWAIAAAKAGRSLAQFIGGTRTQIPIGISLGIQREPDALVQRVQQALAEGYQKVKMKIKPGADVDFVARVREIVGKEAPLMVDANNAYRLDDADHLQRLDEFDLMMIEQPLAWDDLLQHAKLQQRLRTPLCLDESITGPERARDMIELGSGRIINIKPGRVGGFMASIAIHDLCRKHGVPVWCGGMLETGIGRAYNVALASLPNFKLPGDISPSRRYWKKDIVAPEWEMDSPGFLAVPFDRPGIGVEVDEQRVTELATAREEIRQP